MPGRGHDHRDGTGRTLLLWALAASLLINALGAGLFVYRRYLRQVERPPHYQIGRESLFAGLATPAGSTVMLGDSLVDWCEWHELLGRPDVINRGINRSTVSDVAARLDAILPGRPAAIVLMVGINDLIAGAPVADIARRYRALLERIATESPATRIIVQSVLPANRELEPEAPDPSAIRALNAELRDLCQAIGEHTDCTYVPLFARFAGERGELARRFTVDGVHLNYRGYALWRDALLPSL